MIMVKPSIEELTKGGYNRYILVIAAAKAAKFVTEKQNRQRELDNLLSDKYKVDIEKPVKRISDEKPVKVAVEMIHNEEIKISEQSLQNALNAGKDAPVNN